MSEAKESTEATPPPCCAERGALLPLGEARQAGPLVLVAEELNPAQEVLRGFAFGVGFTLGALACAGVAFVVHRSGAAS